MIFTLYTGGHGLKAIAKMLNEQGRKTPALVQWELIGKRLPSTQDCIKRKYVWDATLVRRILENEIYTGTLINHKSERNKINKTYRVVPEAEQFRHEGFLPAIVTREVWEQARFLLDQRKRRNVHARRGQKIHRYAGLLRCADCGRTFVGKRKHYKDGSTVVEYICDTYLRYGKEHCSSHAIYEETLDRLIEDELLRAKRLYQRNWHALEKR